MPLKIQAEFNDHYSKSYPKEAVGLLLTDGTTLRLHNWSRRNDRFLVGYWRVFRKLGWKGLTQGQGVSFIYHSHRIDSYPSRWDKEFMVQISKRWKDVVHLIFVPGTEYMVWQYEE